MNEETTFLSIGLIIGGLLMFLITMSISNAFFISNSELGKHTCSKLELGYKTTNVERSSEGTLEKYQIVCEKPTQSILDGIVVRLV